MRNGAKKCLIWVGAFLCTYIVGTIIFILLFQTPVLQDVDVLMYRGIALLVISVLLIIAVLLLFKRFIYKEFEVKDILLIALTICCINLALFTLLPVTVERSVSVFMLCYMSDHSDTAYTEDDIEKVFIDEYIETYGAFQKRFHEQDVTGSIEETENGYVITDRGKRLVYMFRFIGEIFGTDQRLLYSEE